MAKHKTVTLYPTRDTFVWKDYPDTDHSIYDDLYLSGSKLHPARGLLYFDLSVIPSGSPIIRATLALRQHSAGGYGGPVYVRRILPANDGWANGSTWNYKIPSTVRWAGDSAGDGGSDAGCTQPNVDYSAALLGTITIAVGPPLTVYSTNLGLEDFANLLTANYGLTLIPEPGVDINLYATRYLSVAGHPSLEVEYLIPGGSSKGGLLNKGVFYRQDFGTLTYQEE